MYKAQKTAKDLGLPSGDAVLRNGVVVHEARGQTVRRIENEVGPTTLAQAAPAAFSRREIKTSEVDRAAGFLVGSVPIWLAFTIGSGIAAYGFLDAPLISAGMVIALFAGLCLSWASTWLWHQIFSPDGVLILQAFLSFRLVREEQRHRHRLEKSNYENIGSRR